MSPMIETTFSALGATSRTLAPQNVPDAAKWAVIVAANTVAIHAGNCTIHADTEANDAASSALQELIEAVAAMWQQHSVSAPTTETAGRVPLTLVR